MDRDQKKLLLQHVAEGIIEEMKKQLEKQDKVVTGEAIESLDYIPADKTIVSYMPHILNIEFGRRAGSRAPPPEPIIEWLMLKFGMDRKEAVKKAYPVMKKIAEEGIPASRFVKKGVQAYLGL